MKHRLNASGRTNPIKRRTVLAGIATTAWPLAVRAQPANRIRLVGVVGTLAKDDPEATARSAVLRQTLAALGWTDGVNVRIEYRWGGNDLNRVRKDEADLIAHAPDVILTEGAIPIATLVQMTRSIPIVFVNVVDPVGAGYVASLSRPGGNATGFTQFEYRMSGKWLELLKEAAPNVSRTAVVRNPRLGPGIGHFAVIQALASAVGVEVVPVNAVSADEIEREITAFARLPNGGLIVTPGGNGAYRDLIISLAKRHRLPGVYPFRYYVMSGGLMSYGANSIEPTKRAAGYIDRILKGEQAADLPVQAPRRYELVINLKTAKALGLTIPQTVLARADEVIE